MPCRLWLWLLDRAHNHPWCMLPPPQLSPRPHIAAPLTWRVALPLSSPVSPPHQVILLQHKPDPPFPSFLSNGPHGLHVKSPNSPEPVSSAVFPQVQVTALFLAKQFLPLGQPFLLVFA